MPQAVKLVETEMDILCQCDDKRYRRLMRSLKLSSTERTKGVLIFQSNDVDERSIIHWKFALKMTPKYIIDSNQMIMTMTSNTYNQFSCDAQSRTAVVFK